jgi:hypothetical protein
MNSPSWHLHTLDLRPSDFEPDELPDCPPHVAVETAREEAKARADHGRASLSKLRMAKQAQSSNKLWIGGSALQCNQRGDIVDTVGVLNMNKWIMIAQ